MENTVDFTRQDWVGGGLESVAILEHIKIEQALTTTAQTSLQVWRGDDRAELFGPIGP